MIRSSLELPGGGLTPGEAWSELMAGNQRMREGVPEHPRRNADAREALVSGQRPIAAILSCSDSRVPLEIVFDEGYGDIFAVRTAGPTLSNATIGSVEYAVVELGVPLVVVMTHHLCGAIATARHQAESGAKDEADLPGMLPLIVAGIRRSAALAPLELAPALHAEDLVEGLIEQSGPIRRAVQDGTVRVRGAVYSLETGEVVPV
ncbi:MAG: carbonic anhydrase [bacterium]|nr:carbonic anhydrase [bacterium]